MKTEIEQLLGSYGIHDTENKLITKDLILVLRESLKEAYNDGYYRAIGCDASKEDIDKFVNKRIESFKKLELIKEVKANCICGEEVIVSYSPKFAGRADGKRVFYPDDRMDGNGRKGCIFRCRKCGNVIADTCNEARHERTN